MKRSSLLLTVRRSGETNFVTLEDMEKQNPSPSLLSGKRTLLHESSIEVSNTRLQEIEKEFERLVFRNDVWRAQAADLGPNQSITDELTSLGQDLFSQLVPDVVQTQLQNLPPGDLILRLHEQLIQLPWELCVVQQEFLGNKFRVGREVISSIPVQAVEITRQPSERLQVLIIADPKGDLQAAAQEGETLCNILAKVPELKVKLLKGKGIRRRSLLRALGQYDIVHFAGHSDYDRDRPEQSGWKLADGVLTAKDLRELTHLPSLIFSNSCKSNLLAGATNFIGTFWSVHDASSLRFATTFYKRVAAGNSLGEALTQAQNAVDSGDLTRFSYMLYGSPALRLHSRPQGSLRVSVTGVNEAQVSVHDRPQGTVRSDTPLLITELETGPTHVTVTKPGHTPETRLVTIEPDQTADIQVSLAPERGNGRVPRIAVTLSAGIVLFLALFGLLSNSERTIDPETATIIPAPLLDVKVILLSDGLPTPLNAEGTLAPGDKFSIVLESKEELFVYVFYQNSMEELQLLFSSSRWSRQEKAKPVYGGGRQRVPENPNKGITVRGEAGQQILFVLACRHEHQDLKELVQDIEPIRSNLILVPLTPLQKILEQNKGLDFTYALRF